LQNDCSWYASCDMDALDKVGAGYKSESVTGKGASSGHSGDSDPLFVMPCAHQSLLLRILCMRSQCNPLVLYVVPARLIR